MQIVQETKDDKKSDLKKKKKEKVIQTKYRNLKV